MGLIASNSYLAAFGAGTFVGIASTYFLIKLKYRSLSRKNPNSDMDYDMLNWLDGLKQSYEFEDTATDIRLMLVVRDDLKMQKGKVAEQCGHAAVYAYSTAKRISLKIVNRWRECGEAKIVVRVNSEEELLELERKAERQNVLVNMIQDPGQVAAGARTVLALGPAPRKVLDKLTGHLKLY